jgi:hypothetical protein
MLRSDPPAAAVDMPSAKVNADTMATLMPTSWAARGSWIVARMARPRFVYCRMTLSRSRITSATPKPIRRVTGKR